MRRRAKPLNPEVEAKPPVARKSLKNEGSRVRDLEKRLAEALQRETTTSEILRMISSSPTDVQPVFDAIAQSAARLCEAQFCFVYRFDGQVLHFMAHHGVTNEGAEAVRRTFPAPPSRGSAAARAVLDCSVAQIPDVRVDSDFALRPTAMLAGYRSAVAVPMMRGGLPIGAIAVGRAQTGLFPDWQVNLLKTFADQAVIAIENVRLFKELEGRNRDLTEALEQQTATAEILRVTSSSPTNLQPVLDAIAENAARVCNARDAVLWRLDGDTLRIAAQYGSIPSSRVEQPLSVHRGWVTGRAVVDRQTIHVEDLAAASETEFPEGRERAQRFGHRTTLATPLLREGVALGAILIRRTEVQPFTDKQIKLLDTFAHQAVIAIENVRLFTELQASNRELTTALDTQTATSDILRVISRSQTDLQPVFDTILTSAVGLLRGHTGTVTRLAGDQIDLAAHTSVDDAGDASLRAIFPQSLHSELPHAQAIRQRAPINIADTQSDPGIPEPVRASARARGYHGWVTVPMLHQDEAVGTIAVTRSEAGGFTDEEIALLHTFADQAVIAIENARLFKELQARTGELTRSVGELKALGEVGQAVSSTLDVQTVLDTIVVRAVQLSGTGGGLIYEYDDATQDFHLRATHQVEDELVEALRVEPIRLGEGATGRAAATRAPVQITDALDEREYTVTRIRSILARLGYRSILAVPLLLEQRLLGALVVQRRESGTFVPEVVNLLQTFATQSALAIQNARLFREIADKSAQLEAASRHKSEFLANMSHELRTPLNAVIGFSEVLAQGMFGDINEKQTEYLHDILESGRHLLSLINDILDLSKIEAGRMELERADFDLPSAIENALILVRERASRRGIRLGSTIDKRLGMIGGDERKVKQVLLNLLSNALKFTPEGGQIDVAARFHDDRAEMSVADTGIGIAPTDQDTVFEEFRQVGTADKKAEGTGLGLALSRKFIELHGGRIWVKSQVGMGSTFTFTLPLTIDQRRQ